LNAENERKCGLDLEDPKGTRNLGLKFKRREGGPDGGRRWRCYNEEMKKKRKGRKKKEVK
jgi:hypothetical protein